MGFIHQHTSLVPVEFALLHCHFKSSGTLSLVALYIYTYPLAKKDQYISISNDTYPPADIDPVDGRHTLSSSFLGGQNWAPHKIGWLLSYSTSKYWAKPAPEILIPSSGRDVQPGFGGKTKFSQIAWVPRIPQGHPGHGQAMPVIFCQHLQRCGPTYSINTQSNCSKAKKIPCALVLPVCFLALLAQCSC